MSPSSPTVSCPPAWCLPDAQLACPARRADVIAEPLDDEALLIDGRSGEAYRINHTALEVWQAIDPSRTTLDLAQEMASRYEVDAARALEDVEQLLACFAAAGLLEPAL